MRRAETTFYLALTVVGLWFRTKSVLAYSTTCSSSSASPPPKAGLPDPDGSTAAAAAAATTTTTRIPWLIVGGGIHGVHIASCLVGGEEGSVVEPRDLYILDDGAVLLEKWKARTAATGMKYLRSSARQHLDTPEDSLRHYGKIQQHQHAGKDKKATKKEKKRRMDEEAFLFARDYDRPKLELFNKHSDYVIEKYKLNQCYRQGLVTAIEPNDKLVRVVVSSSSDKDNKNNTIEKKVYLAENVVLAIGNDKPAYPDWVAEDDVEKGIVRHLFDEKNEEICCTTRNREDYSVAVVGGGITAAHKALSLARQRNHNTACDHEKHRIHLICRHSLREQQFDTHQDWMMENSAARRSLAAGGSGLTKRQRNFAGISSWKERRKIIARERISGTLTAAVNRGRGGLRYAIEKGDIQWHQGEVVSAVGQRSNNDVSDTTWKSLTLSTGETLHVDRILLATGFKKRRPGGDLVDDLVQKAGLPVSDFCGFPLVDKHLKWHPRIYVAGALAELEVGPSARNIAGARMAAERILAGALAEKAVY